MSDSLRKLLMILTPVLLLIAIAFLSVIKSMYFCSIFPGTGGSSGGGGGEIL